MSRGLHPYPVVVRLQKEFGTSFANCCHVAIDGGKAYAKSIFTRVYGGTHTYTQTISIAGTIYTDLSHDCGMPLYEDEYDPPLNGTPSEVSDWFAAAPDDITFEGTTYEDEIPAAEIRAAAEAAVEWSDPWEQTNEYLNMPQWRDHQVPSAVESLQKIITPLPGQVDISTARVRATRVGDSMDHIPVIAGWEGETMSDITGAAATTGWLEADETPKDFGLRIGPYI